MKKLFTIRTGLIAMSVLTLLLLGALLATILPYFNKPSPTAQIDVLTNVTPIRVPEVITAGKQFVYQFSVDKNYDTPGNTEIQMVCEQNSVISYVPVVTFNSNIIRGHYDIKRATAVPVNSRSTALDGQKCHFELSVQYTFFVSSGGEDRNLFVTERNTSNTFMFMVPSDAEPTSLLNTHNTIS